MLPLYWIVKNDGSKLFKDTVVKYLNEKYEVLFNGEQVDSYYGYTDGYGKNGVDCLHRKSSFKNNPTLLTLEQFISMTTNQNVQTFETPSGVFTRGEEVEVIYGDTKWNNGIFLAYIEGAICPYVTVLHSYEDNFKSGKEFYFRSFKSCRKLEQKKERKIMMTDAEWEKFQKDNNITN